MKLQPNPRRSQGPQGGQRSSADVEPPEPPRPVLSAVKVMYAGAVLSAIALALVVVSYGSVQSAFRKQYPHDPVSQVHAAAMSYITAEVIALVVAIGLWLVMSWANRLGMSWARAVATGLFVLNTLNFYEYASQPTAVGPLTLNALVWIAGLGATILLWQRGSSAFFAATKDFRRAPLT
jgi:hypothetical protein